MANWYGSARSNYFRVKDETAFTEWADGVDSLHYWKKDECFAICSDCPDSGAWPSSRWDDEVEEHVEFDLIEELCPHLAEGEVAVLVEVGAEKLRYLSGWTVAVNHLGETVFVNLDDIYEKANAAFGTRPNEAMY
jgi:hypothetical protein